MQLRLENSHNQNAIKHYQAGAIQINDRTYGYDLIITAACVEAWTNTLPDLDQLIKHKPDIILLGTGDTMKFPDTGLLLEIQQQGIGIEVMTTAAACRTFNVLLSEDRNVLAALKV